MGNWSYSVRKEGPTAPTPCGGIVFMINIHLDQSGCRRALSPFGRHWYLIAEQPAPAPHFAQPVCPVAALARISRMDLWQVHARGSLCDMVAHPDVLDLHVFIRIVRLCPELSSV